MKDLIVVSGLPRSGTSMMMAALQAGGVSLVLDDLRPADASNPRGYFEYQPVRQLGENSDWLRDRGGQAVKIIYRLLYHIPPDLPTRVLFMERKLGQVISSQNAMLGIAQDEADWHKIYRGELQRIRVWMEKQPLMQVFRVEYEDFLGDPREHAQRIAAFLDVPLDVDAMAAVADPSLHRQRG